MASSNLKTDKKPPDIVIAVDFGTTGTGLAYQLRAKYESDKDKIHEITDWGEEVENRHSFKVPTYLLLKPDNKEGSTRQDNTERYFGYRAESKYIELTENLTEKEQKQWYFFKRFKMQLYKKKDDKIEEIDAHSEVKDVKGKSLKAYFVFGHALQCIKDKALQYLDEAGYTHLLKNGKWVLTVPAIWTDGAKSLMRLAAEKAGIQESMLTIALEPEAAAIYYAISDASPDDDDKRKVDRNLCVGPGTANIVVDMGGGTVDVTTIQIQDDGVIKQVFETKGSPAGGDKVNEEVASLISKLFGSELWNKFKEKFPEEFVHFERSIEQAKVYLETKRSGLSDDFPLSIEKEILGEFSSKHSSLKDAIKSSTSAPELKDEITVKSGKLRLENEVLRKIMQNVAEEILQHILKIIPHITSEYRIEGIVLVGGFAKSHWMFDYMKRTLNKNGYHVSIRRPPYCQHAVLRGAALYGQDERILRTRVLRMTYGVETYGHIKDGMDIPNHRKVSKNGITYIDKYFSKHALRGQSVNIDDWTPYQGYSPIYDSQTSMSLPIYTSSGKKTMYTDDENCVKIGTINVKFDSELPKHKSRRVAFNFGRTEIIVRAYNTDTGDQQFFHLSTE